MAIENGRAINAYECAQNAMRIYSKDEFKSHVKNIPMYIKTNGLGATLAFMLSKGNDYVTIGDCFQMWLKEDNKRIIDLSEVNDFKQFVQKITKISSAEYRTVTNEFLAYLNWLRRFADGLSH